MGENCEDISRVREIQCCWLWRWTGEIRPFPYTIHKDKLKMDERPHCEIGLHQNPRGEYRQSPLWHQPQQLLPRHITKGKGNKSKNELLGLHQDKTLLHIKGKSWQNQKTIDRMGEDICKYLPNEGLVSIVYKEFIKLSTQRTNNPIKNGQRTWTDISPNKTSK